MCDDEVVLVGACSEADNSGDSGGMIRIGNTWKLRFCMACTTDV